MKKSSENADYVKMAKKRGSAWHCKTLSDTKTINFI
jgi:hypothetical protein